MRDFNPVIVSEYNEEEVERITVDSPAATSTQRISRVEADT
jgi:hypothetical protein